MGLMDALEFARKHNNTKLPKKLKDEFEEWGMIHLSHALFFEIQKLKTEKPIITLGETIKEVRRILKLATKDDMAFLKRDWPLEKIAGYFAIN